MQLFHFSLLFTFITGFNTSEEDSDPSQIPYADSDSDLLASPSLDGSTGVTRLPEIFGFSITHTLWTASVPQGGGDSGSGDKTRLYVVPQESTHNGQEKAGSVISALAYTTTHSLTDSTLSFTEKEQDSSLSSAETQWPGVSVSSLTTSTNAYSNTDARTLPEKVPLKTKIHSDIHDDTDTPLVRSEVPNALDSQIFQSSDITVMSSAHTISGPPLTILGASVTEHKTSESHGFHEVNGGGDTSVISPFYAASEERSVSHHSSESFRPDHVPHPNHSNQNNPDVSVTGESNFLSDSVSDPGVFEFSGVMYTDTLEMEASRKNRLLRSTHVNENVSNHTHSSLFGDSGIMTDTPRASVSHRQIDASTLSDSHGNASENVTTTNRKKTEYYSYTPYNTNSPNTEPKLTDSATTAASRTVPREHATVTVHQQTTNQWMSDANTQHAPSESLPTQTGSPSSPATLTRPDFTAPSVSYTQHTLGQGDPINSTTHTSFLHSVITAQPNDPTTTFKGLITALYDTTETKSSTGTETWTRNDNGNASTITSDSNDLSHLTTLSTESRPTAATRHTSSTSKDDPVAPPNPSPAVTPLSHLTSPLAHTLNTVTTSPPPANLHTRQMSHLITTTRWNGKRIQNHLTTSRNTPLAQQPDTTTTRPHVHTNTPSLTGTHTPLTPVIIQTSSHYTVTTEAGKDLLQKGHVFIMEDRPAIINVETFQVLLQVLLEEAPPPDAGLVEVEPFLQKVAGYQSQHVTWHSGPVLQSVVTFRTAEAVSWLRRAESLLQKAGLKPLPTRGVFVSGVRVKNITVGGLHSDVCSWVFSCPDDFYCTSSKQNFTCRSMCHSEYCKNNGICVHQSGQHPLCQCPVGEDFWFMGQRCDLRMTRQRLAGACFGVLASIAVLMGLLAFLVVQHFKKMLIQTKAEQTQSSYRRFNHFDELSARFWRRSWPGSEDSLDNTAFRNSDELLHMRALDRACCYHDDTLSIASTYPDSATHLNTVYPHSSQYHWDMSTCSLADGVIDSGKASDLSVCSWPIEPIQWTPFPLLQQLRNTNTMKPARPRSYCEGMELVGLEKSRTA